MKTDDLIDRLSQDLEPVCAPQNQWTFALLWSFAGLLVTSLVLLAVTPRVDIGPSFRQFGFLLQLFSFAGLLYCSLALVSWMSSPGRKKASIFSIAVLVFIVLSTTVNVLGAGILSHEEMSQGLSSTGFRCSIVALIASLVSGVLFFGKARSGASMNPMLTGLIVGLASLGSGGIAITLHCSSGNGMHIALWHFFAPLFAISAVALFVGRKWLRW